MCSFLEIKEFRVAGACDPAAAVVAIQDEVPPLIISDITMPGKSGL
jgi:YesN/AraC family two-component response regulator